MPDFTGFKSSVCGEGDFFSGLDPSPRPTCLTCFFFCANIQRYTLFVQYISKCTGESYAV